MPHARGGGAPRVLRNALEDRMMVRGAVAVFLAVVGVHAVALEDVAWQAPPRAVDFGPLDPPTLDKTHYTVELENEHVRVVRVRYAPKEAGILHEHRCGRVTVYLSPLHQSLTRAATGEKTESRAKSGEARWSTPDRHTDVNLDDTPIELVYVDVKSACGPAAR
jgi:hypothetical protein